MPAVAVPIPVSYFQYDQQGVVFNMWYFGWFDDAMTQFLGEVGYPYTAMNADGLDVQLVHTEADWRDAVRYGEQVVIDVATERIGSTSFTLSFSVRVGERSRLLDCGIRTRFVFGRASFADVWPPYPGFAPVTDCAIRIAPLRFTKRPARFCARVGIHQLNALIEVRARLRVLR